MKILQYIPFILLLSIPLITDAQDSPCYTVDTIPYAPDSLTAPSSTGINTDFFNGWSFVINLGFPFCFFGHTYTQCLIGNNGCVGFDLSNASGFNTWPIGGPMPSTTPADMHNTIMFPWQSLYYTTGGTIDYQTIGTAPNRKFIVRFKDVPMFNCSSLHFTGQVELSETSSIIEMYIQDKSICSTWNGGLAIEGLQNSTGTDAEIIQGRNATQWIATNDAFRFNPICFCTTGLEAFYLPSFSVYPNPATSVLTISSNQKRIDKLTLYTTDGRLVKSITNLHSAAYTLDVSDLSAGIYVLDCENENGRERVKVVKY